ncbi:NAD(P)-dependent alcohol dehydrogenase [Pseudomonas sp. GD03860]|uniref:NAD(P)-dependent alcohol dehydrogenase n=1 Tax=Pseudomonas TaxID=286 RepID=UPI0023640DD5|nr:MULTISPECIES: NAD(P)-dependent alcohol dehydrogenase [Pseudomonas]MDD2058395.1 NAD(P)-dependent alcohol dehydrogenase [Pseudomonas putida]MDH0640207.1 NAD(P)-dependent alcohol dehydrogenase [Pseudomonas sp. GD03860]
MKIQAALAFASNGPLTIESVDIADPGPQQILVRVVATGLCHTDLNVLANPAMPWPVLFGHEGAGVVEKVGSQVSKIAVGDHVIMTTSSCGKCPSCLAANPSYCTSFRALNMSGGKTCDGGCTHQHDAKPVFAGFLGQSSFASHSLTSERNVIKVDADLPLEVLAPLGCGIQTGAGAVLNTLRPRAGSNLVVFGAGGVGLAALMAAKIAGCRQRIVVDKVQSRLDLAQELGATHVINASDTDAVAAIHEITRGGADYSVEATGVPVVMQQAISALGIGGNVVLVGMAGAQASVTFNPIEVQSKNIKIQGSIMAGVDGVPDLFIPELIGYWKDGLLPVEKLIRFYPFDQINQAIHDAHDGSAIKPVLRLP